MVLSQCHQKNLSTRDYDNFDAEVREVFVLCMLHYHHYLILQVVKMWFQ